MRLRLISAFIMPMGGWGLQIPLLFAAALQMQLNDDYIIYYYETGN